MKVSFSKSVEYTPTFAGNDKLPAKQQMKAQVSPCELGDLFSIIEVFQSLGLEDPAGGDIDTSKLSSSQMKGLPEMCAKVLPSTCKISNLTDGDGNDLTVEDVVKYPFFLPLAMELVGMVAHISSPSDEDEGNS